MIVFFQWPGIAGELFLLLVISLFFTSQATKGTYTAPVINMARIDAVHEANQVRTAIDSGRKELKILSTGLKPRKTQVIIATEKPFDGPFYVPYKGKPIE